VRLVSLLPSATEILYALGLDDQLVGVTFECDEPPSARSAKTVIVGGRDTSGMTPGEIDILNSDGILHNLHTYSTANPSINKAQPKFKKTMTEKLEKPEFVKITCDVHSWMLGWIAVMPHPYFGVTDANGVAKIENAPAGKQTIEVWHETLGKVTKDVEVKAGQTAKVAFEMKK